MKESWKEHPLGNPFTIGDKIVEIAMNYLGQEEVSGNMGFEDSMFEKKMKAVGWEKRQAWCAYFTELVWKEAYRESYPDLVLTLDKLFSGSAVKTWVNFNNSKQFASGRIPGVGSVVVWQNYIDGKPDWRGHAGIVTSVYAERFISVEGNSNSEGGREGIEIAIQKRRMLFDNDNGLRLKGFIYPFIPEVLI